MYLSVFFFNIIFFFQIFMQKIQYSSKFLKGIKTTVKSSINSLELSLNWSWRMKSLQRNQNARIVGHACAIKLSALTLTRTRIPTYALTVRGIKLKRTNSQTKFHFRLLFPFHFPCCGVFVSFRFFLFYYYYFVVIVFILALKAKPIVSVLFRHFSNQSQILQWPIVLYSSPLLHIFFYARLFNLSFSLVCFLVFLVSARHIHMFVHMYFIYIHKYSYIYCICTFIWVLLPTHSCTAASPLCANEFSYLFLSLYLLQLLLLLLLLSLLFRFDDVTFEYGNDFQCAVAAAWLLDSYVMCWFTIADARRKRRSVGSGVEC